MALTPHIHDKNRAAELKRKQENPASFGVGRIIARPIPGRNDTPPPDPEANRSQSRLDMIIEGIGVLEPENPDHFTKAGLPNIEYLEALVQLPNITAAERDEAFAAFQTSQASDQE